MPGARKELSLDLMRWLRLAEKEALHLRAPFQLYRVELILGLDALRRRLHAKTPRHGRNSANDIERTGGHRNVLYERAVDLDLVKGETLEVSQGRVPGAKIIHGDMYTQCTQAVERRERGRIVLQQDILGDLELESVRIQSGGRQRIHHHLHQATASELCR